MDRLRGLVPTSTLRPPVEVRDNYTSWNGSPQPIVRASYGIARGREPSDVTEVRRTWRRHQDGTIIRRVTRAIDHNTSGVDEDRFGDVGVQGRLTARLARRGMGISSPRSTHIVTDSRTGAITMYVGTSSAVHHPEISEATGDEMFVISPSDTTRQIHSGHIADVQLAGGHQAVIFTDDRICRGFDGRFDSKSRELARELGKHGIVLISSEGYVVE